MFDPAPLFAAARAARQLAYAPYSGFKVGAAVAGASGRIYVGCNVENAAYPLGLCAEAGAIAAMAAGGETRLTAALVLADAPDVTPCGGCRQMLREFGAPDTPIFCASLARIHATHTIGALLPGAFGPHHLGALGGG